jgi:hypothetical protein
VAVPELMVKTRIRSHKRVFTWFVSRRPQTPAEASLEASLEIQRPQGAGRPCYEAGTTPLAVENGVGKLAAKARQMSARERECGELPSPNLSLFDRKVGQGLFVFGGRETLNSEHRTPNFE